MDKFETKVLVIGASAAAAGLGIRALRHLKSEAQLNLPERGVAADQTQETSPTVTTRPQTPMRYMDGPPEPADFLGQLASEIRERTESSD